MIIFDLISRESKIEKRKFALLGCLSALSNAMILAVINAASFRLGDNPFSGVSLYFLVLFLLAACIYGLTQKRLLTKATHHVEAVIDKLRCSMVNRVRNCELDNIEKIGQERILNVMNKELQTISQSAQVFVIVAQNSVLVMFASIYIAWLSLPAFFIITASILIGAFIHWARSKEINHQLALAFQGENDLMKKLSHFLRGFKEIKLSRARARELQQDFAEDSKAVTTARKKTLSLFAEDYVSTHLTFYMAIGSILFVVPALTSVEANKVVQITTATLFLIGPISSAVGGLPSFASANAAAVNLLELEKELQQAQVKESVEPGLTDFKQIELKNLHFEYRHGPDEVGFEVGPINFTIEKGQTIFVTGGNGSGKTTFIRLLMGLYPASRGSIIVDGKPIPQSQIDGYRNLFTAVFADFHLFERLYGISDYSQEDVSKWLDYLEMSHKVSVSDDRFSTVELSTGQRKRLALFCCILEARPIYVFDEWAADQDPHFREKFYQQVLPELKAREHTVIAITHDDKYFNLADVHLKVSDGQISKG